MTYAEKLRSPLWQKKRLVILDRDGWACKSCGSTTKNLQVHHLVYARHTDPWGYSDDCYQTLCGECHEERQELTDKITNALRLALKDLPTKRIEIVGRRLCGEAMKGMEGVK